MSTETKFTPGPWFLGRSENGADAIIAPRIGLPPIVVAFPCLDSAMSEEQGAANAVLIKHAPDLFAACERVVMALGFKAPKQLAAMGSGVAEAIDACADALTKARGT